MGRKMAMKQAPGATPVKLPKGAKKAVVAKKKAAKKK